MKYNDNFFLSLGMIRNFSLNEQVSWYIELYDEIEQYPVKDYTQFFRKDRPSEYSVCIDNLDIRCAVMIELLDKSKGNSEYQIKLAEKLKIKFKLNNREDLSKLLDQAVDRRKLRDIQILEELGRLKNKNEFKSYY